MDQLHLMNAAFGGVPELATDERLALAFIANHCGVITGPMHGRGNTRGEQVSRRYHTITADVLAWALGVTEERAHHILNSFSDLGWMRRADLSDFRGDGGPREPGWLITPGPYTWSPL